MTDGLCERSSKSSVRSSAGVVKAVRRQFSQGHAWHYGIGIDGVKTGFWFGVLSVIIASLSKPGSSCGQRGNNHINHGKSAASTLTLSKEEGFFFSRSPSFPALTPSIFPLHYFYSLCGSPASLLPRRHLYKSFSFNI